VKEREGERERGREKKRERERERERTRERKRDVAYGYVIYFIAFNNGGFFIFKRNDGCLGTF
jgi:hypothetical protein